MRDDNFRWLIEEIREANDIADVIGEYLDLRNNKAVCPFHGDTNPSFSVNSQEQYFHCFGCRESGDVFKFLQLHEKLPFMEAVRQLADRAGIRPPSLTPEDLQELEETRLREEILTETADFYCRDLPKEIKGYLKKRSFTQNSIAAFHIGYASGGLEQHLLKQCKFTEEQCIKAGVLRKARDRTKDYFFNRTIFPNFKRGRCVHLTGRIVGPKDPKYLHLRGVIRHLFNEDAVHADTVYLAEGIPDCISLDQLGYSAVATLGASLNQEHARKFSDCETVFICFDGDAAGREGAPKVARLLGTKARIVELPDGLDVNEYFQKHTKAEFDKLVSAALDFVTYEVNQIPANTKKTRLPKILKPLLRQLAKLEPAEAEAYLTDVIKPHFKLTGEDVKAYRQQVKRYQKEEAKPKSTVSQSSPYESTEGGMVLHKPDGTKVLLSNFTARIAAEVVEDDGVETRNVFQIEAHLKGRSSTFTVPATQFPQMNWVTQNLGAEAVVYAGYGAKDHCRAAIQLLSEEVPRTHVYTYVGWRKVGGVWVFLHENGAIGPIGPVPNIHTQLFGAVARYTLPPPPTPENLRKAIKASLQFLDLAPLWVTVPLLAAAYRAPLGPADFGLHIAGPTGAGKSELVARAQQHYGPAMDRLNLPANWSSTDNALEGLAFSVKEALLAIDDFSPSGSSYDVARWHKKADRVLRAQGNLSGRHRMWADGTLRPVKPPRGLIVSTGEDIPRGQSLGARFLILEVSPGDVEWDVLTKAQQAGAQGLYAQAMAGYLCWLADQYESIQRNFQRNLAEVREDAVRSSAHMRTPEIVANLAIGLYWFRLYAETHGIFTKEEGRNFFKQGWDALGEAADEQVKHQQSSEPARRFLELLAAAIASGKAYVAGSDGSYPSKDPESWGWRRVPRGQYSDPWKPQGALVGWLDHKDSLYLEPEASFAVAQRMAKEGSDGIPIASKTLHRRLREQGLLKSTDEKRGRVLVRRHLQGQRRAVLHLHKDILYDLQKRPKRPIRPTRRKKKQKTQ